jgi:glycosyltransferase involved in cell wall biosynthesis
MKVLMYGWEFPPHFTGGLGIACYGIVHGLLTNNIEVALVLPRNTSLPEYNERCFQSISTPFSITSIHSLLKPYIDEKRYQEQLALELTHMTGLVEYSDGLLGEVQRYAALASQYALQTPHDVIHAHDWLTILAGIEARRLSRKPLIFQVHALEIDRSDADLNQDIFQIEHYGLHAADRIIAVSHYTKNRIIERYGIAAEKILVSYNGLFRHQRPKIKESVITNRPFKTVLFLGRLTYQKGLFYFIEAARRILETRNDIQFVIAGEGDLLSRAIDHVAHLKLGTSIHFTYFLDRELVSKMYHLSDVYVMPSVSEPFGIGCLEALEHHVPVIISKQSGVSEVLDCMITVDFWDTELLKQKIIELIDEPEIKKQLLAKIDEKLDHLSWERITKNIVACYRNLIHERIIP